MPKIKSSEITPKGLYVNRRNFLKLSAIAAAKLPRIVKSPLSTQEPPTPYVEAIRYNNFYEFGASKDEPAINARDFRMSPWTVSVEGLVKKPQKLDMNSITALAPLEERIYPLRCVETWSVVVPWIGYPLSVLLQRAEPDPKAKYVAFESFYDPKQMPWAQSAGIPFPYREGLRLDEAMHPLTILCLGMYGEPLPPQEGAPVRLIIPWKYGFKSIKSLVKITLVDRQPPTTWSLSAPTEYGFYANVNPSVPHPRWSQAKERRLGSRSTRSTLLFNGYGDQVAQLYSGMNLRKFF
jgi:sulfoxide reductase catalytic subunit YedY